jgi:uncharacterized protein YlxW (UPF0749 family)
VARGQRPGLVLPSILLVLGLLVTAAVVQERGREERLPRQAEELTELIARRRAATRELSSELAALSERLASAQAAQAEGSEEVRAVVARVEQIRPAAGLAPMEGPGVVVELRDSAEAPRTRGEVLDLRIQDVDIQLVVNALWAAGGRAVAVNGRRVTATTAIREAGGRVQVNFQPVSSPYRITAIGEPDALRAGLDDSEIAEQLKVWTEIYGLGFSVRGEDALRVPGLEAGAGLSWARPAEGGAR